MKNSDLDRAERALSRMRHTLRPKSIPELKLRWWYLGHINCDCASYDHHWKRAHRSGEWVRCHLCNRRVGDMEVTFYGKFKATTPEGAWRQYEAGKKTQAEWNKDAASHPIT